MAKSHSLPDRLCTWARAGRARARGRLLFVLAAAAVGIGFGTLAAAAAPSDLGLEREIWISLRPDGQPGAGTLADPFDGTGGRFDAKLRELFLSGTTNVHVRILPGLYTTQGTLAWLPRDGWRIQGAGMDATILQLTNVNNNAWAVIGTQHREVRTRIEVSDLTVDCNYGPNNPNYANAVSLAGYGHTIRRVKAINAYGELGVFENFVLNIASGGADSERNLIEECEVTRFKGTYCIGIAFGGPDPISQKSIQGIIRGNKVYDLKGAPGLSSLVAYSAAGVKDTILENNVSYRCDIPFFTDTGTSRNLMMRGNQFIGCRVQGITIVGQWLDNFIIENNIIELDAASSRGWALVVHDQSGRNKLTAFKIRNNVIRSINGLSSASGGIAVSLLNAESCQVTGNRIEAGLRNLFQGPGMQLVDNTDFQGRPARVFAGFNGNQVNFPTGESGTLLLNKGSAYIIPETGPDPVANGASLLAASARARTMTPNGLPLSASNRAVVYLLPGTYALPDSALVLSAPYVDLKGLAGAGAVRLESEGNVLVQTANDVVLENLTLHCTSSRPPVPGAQDKAAYFPAGNLDRTVIRNCVFGAGNQGWSMRLGVNYAGYYENCTSGPHGWGSLGGFSGVAVNCTAGPNSFAAQGLFTGAATNCTAGPGSFGADGLNNFEEFLAGTHPFETASVLEVLDVVRAPGGALTLSFPCLPARTYTVAYSADLVSWQETVPVTVQEAAPGICQWTDDGSLTGGAPANGGSRFYRIVVRK